MKANFHAGAGLYLICITFRAIMPAAQVIMALSFRFDCGQSGVNTRIKPEFTIHLQWFLTGCFLRLGT